MTGPVVQEQWAGFILTSLPRRKPRERSGASVVACCTVPNVVVEWLAFPLGVREVPGCNFDPDTGCPGWGFSWYSPVHPGKCRPLPSRFFPMHYSLIVLSVDAVSGSVVKQATNAKLLL
jgi:hypothetical protein